MSVAQRIARNAGALAVSQGATLLLNFVAWTHLARTLEPDRFGILGFGGALLAYFVVVVQLGFDAVAVREGAREPEAIRAIAGHLTTLRLALAATAGIVYVALVLALPRPPLFQATLLALGVQLIVNATRLSWAFQAVEQMGAIAVRDAVTALLNAVAVVVLVRAPEQVVLAAALTAALPLVGNAWLFAAFVRRFGAFRLSVDVQAWARLLRPALPLAASAFLIEVYLRLDQVMLEFMVGTVAVGQYSAAYKLVTLAQMPASIVYGAFFPALAVAVGDPALMRERGRMIARILLAVGLPIAIAGPWLAGQSLDLVYGAEYVAAGPALAVLLVNMGFVYVSTSVGTPLMAWDLQTPYMWAVLAGAVVNVALNVVLIPRFAMVGAASATLVSQIAVCAGLCVVYRRAAGELPISLLLPALAVAAAATLPAAGGAILGLPFLVSLALSVLAAAAAAYALGLLRLADLRPSSAPPPDA